MFSPYYYGCFSEKKGSHTLSLKIAQNTSTADTYLPTNAVRLVIPSTGKFRIHNFPAGWNSTTLVLAC